LHHSTEKLNVFDVSWLTEFLFIDLAKIGY